MRILLAGFFGESNLGDEAIRQGLLEALPDGIMPLVTSGSNRPLRQELVFPRRGLRGWFSFLRALRAVRADGGPVIFSGGILQDWTFEGVTFFALRILAAANHGSPPQLWGAGLGPLKRSGARALARHALRRVQTAWLRDPQSCSLFESLTGREAHLGADWSWGLSPVGPDCPDCPDSPDSKEVRSETVGLNLRPWVHEAWVEAARDICRRQSDTISWIGVTARPEDSRLLQREWPAIPLFEPGSFSHLMHWAKSLTIGVAMRYHVILAFLRAGIPTLALPYDPKVEALTARFSRPGNPNTTDAHRKPSARQPGSSSKNFHHGDFKRTFQFAEPGRGERRHAILQATVEALDEEKSLFQRMKTAFQRNIASAGENS